MIDVRQQVDLAPWNSFHLAETAEYFCQVETTAQLRECLTLAERNGWPLQIIGGGSNLLLAGPLSGLLVVIRSRGRRVLQRDPDSLLVEVEAGENWHQLVNWTLDLGLSGLENLALIPGTAGAAPVQNIGAYGVELADCFDSLDALDRQTGECLHLTREDCRFAYRDSLFKQQAGRWLILRIRLRLSRRPLHRIDYAPLRQAWEATGVKRPDPRLLAELVCAIRRSKLPDPDVLGNAGSFFKNPLVAADQALALAEQYPQLPQYPQSGGQYKLAAGWLIEQAGWKGRRLGPVGVHSEQALVLVNHGGARGRDVLVLADAVAADVQARFGVALEREPVLLGQVG
ncbi:MAG: UDP-N-acetylmuramate dehydrogenase [Halopseudomonas yangmingensis]|uniref:UDP-N-acetylenolpyruvoylglucosamine reductase n=1 Tax=Halopseudomonas yangmingensis TaxID=1720063 RepID=A0A1I4QDL9_9GAMM|nr:UDP-N-acetylmuramate dehydrogenase [Halopseudomonas yangmingensis]SFM38191.1 UDP-N-acetylmuramate dehydrogenase [Halopseudomonas yangmingensis]